MANGLNDEFTRRVAEQATGSALRLQDIDGVGDQTIRNLRSAGFRNIQDVRNASVEELERVPGIGSASARTIISQAGGSTTQRKSTGSVSAAGIKMPVGEFKVEVGDKDKAEANMASSLNRGIGRSKQAAQSDKGKRAPVTTDYEVWKANKGRLDFPGVDTPTEDPQVQAQDRLFNAPEDTTLEEREGSLFVRDSNVGGGGTSSLKGLFSGGRGAGPETRAASEEVAMEDIGADVSQSSGGEAVADVTFLERDKEGFGEELIPFGAEESDRKSFEF